MGEFLNPQPHHPKDNKVVFLMDEKASFQRHMEILGGIAHERMLPLKVSKYLNLYKSGFPLDSTVRYYDGISTPEITDRVEELCGNGFEVWASFATPGVPDSQVSIQQKTPLVKAIESVTDYGERVGPILDSLPKGTWVKLFYDTHKDELAQTVSCAVRLFSPCELSLDQREIVVGWGNTSDVRLIDRHIEWSSANPTWRYMGRYMDRSGFVDDLKVIGMIRKIMGPSAHYRRKMALLAHKEGRRSICFELKIRENTQLPIFFIDYEYAGKANTSSFGWFFYGREGD